MDHVLTYLEDVLGVRTWIGDRSAVVAPTPLLTISMPADWAEGKLALAQRIIASSNLGGVPIVAGAASSAHVLAFDAGKRPERVESEEGVRWNLGPMEKLMSGAASEIQKAKREVWNLLKQMNEELGGP